MVTEGGLPAQSLTRRSMHLFVAQTSRVEKIQMHLSDHAVYMYTLAFYACPVGSVLYLAYYLSHGRRSGRAPRVRCR